MNRGQLKKIGGFSAFLAVGLGAFGAHALKDRLIDSGLLSTWETASQYHLIHSIAMLLPWSMGPGRLKPAVFFLIGIFLFSGSLYLLAFTGIRWLGMITPLGGVSFLAGWLLLAFFSESGKRAPTSTGPSGQ